jgi:hypothetical protein
MSLPKRLVKLFRQLFDNLGLMNRRKKSLPRGHVPWDEPYERRRSNYKYKK